MEYQNLEKVPLTREEHADFKRICKKERISMRQCAARLIVKYMDSYDR